MREYLNHPERLAILKQLIPMLREPENFSPDEAQFNELALMIFRYQFARCEPFRLLCEGAGFSDSCSDYRQIPCAPTDAFKYYRLACFPPSPIEIRFHTSGTTQGREGIHTMPTPNLYNAAAMTWFGRAMLPENHNAEMRSDRKSVRPLRFLSLTASPSESPHSSLIHMISTAGRLFSGKLTPKSEAGSPAACSSAVEYFYSDQSLRMDAFLNSLNKTIEADQPVLLFTTAFALIQLLDALDLRGISFKLRHGSRIMETGGYKGRSRELQRDELYRWASSLLDVPTRCIVNEYGMTEMSSQFYDRTLSDPDLPEQEARIKTPPPWVRSFVVNPATLRPVGDGETGILQHIDLANLDSCAFLRTADLARKYGDGFELLGRLHAAEQRGCSLDYELARR